MQILAQLAASNRKQRSKHGQSPNFDARRHPAKSAIARSAQQTKENGLCLIIRMMRENHAAQALLLNDRLEPRQPQCPKSGRAILWEIFDPKLDLFALGNQAFQIYRSRQLRNE